MVQVDRISIKILDAESSAELHNFRSEDLNLNIFLRRKSRKHQNELLAVTYLLYFDNEIIGYYTLSSDTMPATDIEKNKFQKGKQYESYPAIKIGRLAISEQYAQEGYGSWLLSAIKYKFANEQQQIGGRYLLVDAYKNVLHFYKKNDFLVWQENDEFDETADTVLMYYDLMRSKVVKS